MKMYIITLSFVLFCFFLSNVGYSQNTTSIQSIEKSEIEMAPKTAVEMEKSNETQMKKEEKEMEEQMKIAVTRKAMKITPLEPKKD